MSNEKETQDLVVNNVLCYISSARHSLPNDQIIQCCLPFYDYDEIKDAKDIIFKSLKEKSVRRRGDNAKKAEIQDILDALVKMEEREIPISCYVANSFKAMPPTSGFELIGSMLTTLFDEISSLKNEIKSFKNSNRIDQKLYADTAQVKCDIKEIKHDINFLKLKSNERNLSKSKLSDVGNLSVRVSRLESHSPSAPTLSQIESKQFSPSSSKSSPSPITLSGCQSANFFNDSDVFVEKSSKINLSSDVSTDAKALYSEITKHKTQHLKDNKKTNDSSKFFSRTNVPKSFDAKKNAKIIGTKKISSNSKLKPAPRTYDVYIGNCDISIDENTLRDYIINDLNLNVGSISELNSKSQSTKSFKVNASIDVRDKLLNSDLWPVGLVCRKFFNFSKK